MKISLVTLSFNQIDYLKEALDSVLDQGYPELDYIVVDPGSTDGSRALIQSYRTALAHVIFEPDHGAADGLNKGFSKASGEIFGFLNADDLLMKDSLKRVAAFFTMNPECDIAFGNGHTIDGKGQPIRYYKARNFSVNRYFFGGARWLQQSTFFQARAFAKSPRFNVENRTCWDGELFVKMVMRGAKVGYIDSNLASFRVHAASISGSGKLNEQFQRDSSRIFAEVQGREWRATDNLLRLLYRTTGFISGLS